MQNVSPDNSKPKMCVRLIIVLIGPSRYLLPGTYICRLMEQTRTVHVYPLFMSSRHFLESYITMSSLTKVCYMLLTCSSMLLAMCSSFNLFAENVDVNVTMSKLQKHRTPLHSLLLSKMQANVNVKTSMLFWTPVKGSYDIRVCMAGGGGGGDLKLFQYTI